MTIKCDECNGTGIVLLHTNDGPYNREFNGDCPECNGSGEIDTMKYLNFQYNKIDDDEI